MTDKTPGGNWAVKETHAEVDGEPATVGLGLAEATRGSFPDEWLDEQYDVVDVDPDTEDALSTECDLLVLDEATVADLGADALAARVHEARPVLLPVLLVTEANAGSDLDVASDVVAVDANRAVLEGRMESLLRSRRLSIELDEQNERLGLVASAASHDLRNPLNIASGRLELLVTQYDDEHLVKAAESLEHMEELIKDVLTLARNGTTVTETEPVHFRTVVGGAWGQLDAVEANLEQSGTDACIHADKPRLRPLLEELFENAVQHGGPDVTVQIEVDEDGFVVADDGPGIPDEEVDSVLERGNTTDEDGTGFGLNIVEAIATAHGWEVDIGESDAGGTRVAIRGISVTDT
jgi:signal transduction histidine kinase